MDLQKLALKKGKLKTSWGSRKISTKGTQHKRVRKFLKGPIPWEWLSQAAQRPGKSLHVAIAIWHLSNLNCSCTVRLSGICLRELGVNRHAGYRALKFLEAAGLVSVIRHAGRNPVVTILNRK